jgi:hypothetical protein
MKTHSNSTTHPEITIGELRISTNLALHPDFTKNPDRFALSHHVELVDCVLPEISFKKDRNTYEKVESAKANIHLVRHKAVCLFVHNSGSGYHIRSIAVNPVELLHKCDQHLVSFPSLDVAVNLLRSKIEPLLADPLDAQHIVPGHTHGDKHLAFWSGIECRALLPDLQLACFHDISHPLTGPAQGSTRKRIELRSSDGGCKIVFEKTYWEGIEANRMPRVESVSVTLTLTRNMLPAKLGSTGMVASVQGTKRLVDFSAGDVAPVFSEIMRDLEGTYLPVPPEWAAMGKAVTPAKTIALLSELTGIPVGEIRAMDEQIRHPSKSTRARLDDDVPAAAACLKPLPVASLFVGRE